MSVLPIIYQDQHFVVIDKPSGYHVHQPELLTRRVPRDVVCLSVLRQQIEQYLYPVHRLDVATSGVLIFALNKEAARKMSKTMNEGGARKTYFAVVRGHTPERGVIAHPLRSDSSDRMLAASTRFRSRERVELPFAVGKRHSTSRYSLIEAEPLTGRFHQIRRHLARESHPIVGDCTHGDSHHNRFFRETLQMRGLFLKAHQIETAHPFSGERVTWTSAWGESWQTLFTRFNWSPPRPTSTDSS